MTSDILSSSTVIDAPTADKMCEDLNIDKGALMLRLLPQAAAYAHVPISNFHVGAVAEGASGALYFGTNIEFEDLPLSASVHGEQCAINHAMLSGETGIRSIAVNAAPCGYCRQFMNEISTDAEDFLIRLEGHKAKPLSHFLPSAFGPDDLGIADRLMLPTSHGMTISNASDLAIAALAAANASYAPYSGNFSGVAVQTEDGTIYQGRYSENAAYNPSMSPMQSAIALMTIKSVPNAWPVITSVVLVEAMGKISQKASTEQVLASVAPDVSLDYFPI